MITNIDQMTTPSNPGMPSGFAMPTCGRAFGIWVTRERSVDLRTSVILDARRAVNKGHLGFVAHVPGTHAWSPPVC